MTTVELLEQLVQRCGLPPDTPIHTFPPPAPPSKISKRRGVIVEAAFADLAVLVVALAVSPDGKLGISLRDGERGTPIVGRGRVDGLLEAGDEIIAVDEHNLQHLAYGEVVELLRAVALGILERPPGHGHWMELRVLRSRCTKLTVPRDTVGKVIGTGGSNFKILRALLGVPLVLRGASTVAFPLGEDDEEGIFTKESDLLVCSRVDSIVALARSVLWSVTNGGLFVLHGTNSKWISHSRFQDIEEKNGTTILHIGFLDATSDDPFARSSCLKLLLKPTFGRNPKIREALLSCVTHPARAPERNPGETLSGMAMDGVELVPPPRIAHDRTRARTIDDLLREVEIAWARPRIRRSWARCGPRSRLAWSRPCFATGTTPTSCPT
ncbi:unnamed protein product [Ectocarpus sp. 6 AP-2014]